MARTPVFIRVFVCCMIAGAAAAAGTYETLQATSYTQLKPVAGQWKISVAATRTADKAVFEPQVCDSEKLSAACNQPLLTADAKDKLKVQLQLKDKALKTIDNLSPKRVLVRACYTKPSTLDRPWRKAADVIDNDKSCPFIIKSAEYNSTAYSFDWPIPKNMTKASWYASVLVQCSNGTGLSFCQYDSTKNQTYWGTNIINSTPPGMVVATAVASAVGPLFLGAYFLKDVFSRGKGSS